MRSYRNASLDLIEWFEECKFNLIPKVRNGIIDSLATSVANFKIHMYPNSKYEIEVKHTLSVPDNVKNWQVFEDDIKIQSFLNITGDFDGLIIDEDNMFLEGSTLTHEFQWSHTDVHKEMPPDDIVFLTKGVVGKETEEAIRHKL